MVDRRRVDRFHLWIGWRCDESGGIGSGVEGEETGVE